MAQREIKFRAYSNMFNEGKMFYDVGLMLKEDGYWWVFNNMARLYKSGNRCTIMQYTGLKDKNGKEIYEGDVYRDTIEYDEQDEYLYFICTYVKSQSAFCWVINVDYKLGFHELDILPEDIEDYSTICNYDLHKIQIIGNIYEKPELLNN